MTSVMSAVTPKCQQIRGIFQLESHNRAEMMYSAHTRKRIFYDLIGHHETAKRARMSSYESVG